MTHKLSCEELNRIKLEAIAALRSARHTRRSRDLSFHEDVELTRSEHQKIDALLKHLLSGHDGNPCPAGDRPIVGMSPTSEKRLAVLADSPRQAGTLALQFRRR
ncbi:MAG: hypothetical protein ACRD59_18220 [Candidatus Acidiferrales bacterium]